MALPVHPVALTTPFDLLFLSGYLFFPRFKVALPSIRGLCVPTRTRTLIHVENTSFLSTIPRSRWSPILANTFLRKRRRTALVLPLDLTLLSLKGLYAIGRNNFV